MHLITILCLWLLLLAKENTEEFRVYREEAYRETDHTVWASPDRKRKQILPRMSGWTWPLYFQKPNDCYTQEASRGVCKYGYYATSHTHTDTQWLLFSMVLTFKIILTILPFYFHCTCISCKTCYIGKCLFQ